jgi:purine nucleosidase
MPALLAATLVGLLSLGPNCLPGERTPVIVIADVGIDDAGALLLALASPELDVLGVVASFGGHDDVRVTKRNAEAVIAASNRTDVPVFLGPPYAIGTTARPELGAGRVHGSDGFGCTSSEQYRAYVAAVASAGGAEDAARLHEMASATYIERCTSPKGEDDAPQIQIGEASPDRLISGPEFIVATARARPREVSILCFSPMTSLAAALMLEPQLPEMLKSVIAMGGAVERGGNAAALGEANFVHDAAAARQVVRAFRCPLEQCGRSGRARLVLAPLDVTHRALINKEDVQKIGGYGGGGRLFADSYQTYQNGYCRLGKQCTTTPLHDAHPVMYLVEPRMFTRVEAMDVDVLVSDVEPAKASHLGGHPAHGMSLVDPRRQRPADPSVPTVDVLLDIDADRFRKALHERLERGSARFLDPTAAGSCHAAITTRDHDDGDSGYSVQIEAFPHTQSRREGRQGSAAAPAGKDEV